MKTFSVVFVSSFQTEVSFEALDMNIDAFGDFFRWVPDGATRRLSLLLASGKPGARRSRMTDHLLRERRSASAAYRAATPASQVTANDRYMVPSRLA